jgi:hypothetical protein
MVIISSSVAFWIIFLSFLGKGIIFLIVWVLLTW